MTEKDEEISRQRAETSSFAAPRTSRHQATSDLEGRDREAPGGERRVSKDSQQKIAQLNERIKELNQRIMIAEGGPKAAAGQGFLKR